MSNVRIVTENLSDNTVLQTNVDGATDVDNLQKLSKSKIFRTNCYNNGEGIFMVA